MTTLEPIPVTNGKLTRHYDVARVIQALIVLPEVVERLEKLSRQKPATAPKRKKFYDLKDAAEYLNMSVTSVRRLIKRGLLKKAKGVGKILLLADSVENLDLSLI